MSKVFSVTEQAKMTKFEQMVEQVDLTITTKLFLGLQEQSSWSKILSLIAILFTDTFEISINKNATFDNLLDEILDERCIGERQCISLMFKNEFKFFDGSVPAEENFFKNSAILSEIFEFERTDDGTVELIYKVRRLETVVGGL